MDEITDSPATNGPDPDPKTAVVIEVDADLADEQVAELEALGYHVAVDDFLAEARDEEDDDQKFTSLHEMETSEELEHSGIWVDWSAIPGASLLIAHPENARFALDRLERKYRRKKKVSKPNEPLPMSAQEAIWCEAFYGRSVRGWKMPDGDQLLEFNYTNWRRLWKMTRFRRFVARELNRLTERVAEQSEAVAKNS